MILFVQCLFSMYMFLFICLQTGKILEKHVLLLNLPKKNTPFPTTKDQYNLTLQFRFHFSRDFSSIGFQSIEI